MDIEELNEQAERILAEVERAVVGKRDALELVLLGILSDGHVLIEDFPGLAKTLIARSFARVTGMTFSRIQFTPDLMPADVTGSSIYNQQRSDFEFRPGPIFGNLLLGDEINRAPPKTQAALLEAMQEKQVTIEGTTHVLEPPFIVLATQNPIEYEGTYPLPEAQLDRFTMRIAIGYPPLADEARMLTEQTVEPPLDSLEPVSSAEEVLAVVEEARRVFVEESLNRYVVALLRHTRSDPRLYLGASPRSGIALLRVAKARALLDEREYVEPGDVKAIAEAVLAHRLIVAPEARAAGLSGIDLVREAVEKTPVPV
jgi:MoxR-like ATPase